MDGIGLDRSGLVQRDGRNQHAVIVIDEQTGERAVLWDRDEALQSRRADVPFDDIGRRACCTSTTSTRMRPIRAALHARRLGIPVTSDLDRMTSRTDELVMAVSCAIFADGLPEQLTGERDHERALRRLRSRHDGTLVVTVGQLGAVALDGDRFLESPGFAVNAVDTTGAGDVFRGGFIYGLLHGWPIDRILRLANAAAAVACTRLGAMACVPSLDEVLALGGAPEPSSRATSRREPFFERTSMHRSYDSVRDVPRRVFLEMGLKGGLALAATPLLLDSLLSSSPRARCRRLPWRSTRRCSTACSARRSPRAAPSPTSTSRTGSRATS